MIYPISYSYTFVSQLADIYIALLNNPIPCNISLILTNKNLLSSKLFYFMGVLGNSLKLANEFSSYGD